MLLFGFWICVFHPIQWLAFKIFGVKAQQKMVQLLNFFLLRSLWVAGINPTFENLAQVDPDRPLIIVANHQSMFDIIGMIWLLRKYNPIFVSKKELASGVPSISYNLRVGGAANIDRKDGKQAIVEIARLGKLIEETNFAAVIFPEGTRSRSKMRDFQSGGVATLIKKAPNALVVPLAINGTGKMDAFKVYPIRCFQNLSWTTLTPLNPKDFETVEDLLKTVKTEIGKVIGE
jgi:1-acyl-sn-glycerol-3-phosphate acyltransferase